MAYLVVSDDVSVLEKQSRNMVRLVFFGMLASQDVEKEQKLV